MELLEFVERMTEKSLKDIGTISNHSVERRNRRAKVTPLEPELPPFPIENELPDASGVQQWAPPNP